MVWTCRAQHRLDCRSTQAECGCTEKIWQAKEIMGWSAWEWQKEARYGFCWPSEPFWVERTPSRKSCQKAQPSVEENRALKWIWWWWWWWRVTSFLYTFFSKETHIVDCQCTRKFCNYSLPFQRVFFSFVLRIPYFDKSVKNILLTRKKGLFWLKSWMEIDFINK